MTQHVGRPAVSPTLRAEKGAPDTTVIVAPGLDFSAADVRPGWSFGNGVTIGGLGLADGRSVLCCWVVMDDPCPCATQATKMTSVAEGALAVVMPPDPRLATIDAMALATADKQALRQLFGLA